MTELPLETEAFYRDAFATLTEANVPFLVGGAYAFAQYTGIVRHTKDTDVFVRPADAQRALDALARKGYATELTFPHWLGKAYCGDDFVDVIFSSGNSLATVDDRWFEHAIDDAVLEVPVKLIPPEEMIWSKAFVMERERYDGADIAHIIRARADTMDWQRLVARFGAQWRVLFAHLVLFGFAYPGERTRVPAAVMRAMGERLSRELDTAGAAGLCRGTMISREQYLIDVNEWGYTDARTLPPSGMTSEEIETWTADIDK